MTDIHVVKQTFLFSDFPLIFLENPRLIQYPATDLKMELLVKIVNDFKLSTIFVKNHYFKFVAGSEFAPDYNKSNVSYETKELYHGFLERWLLLPG